MTIFTSDSMRCWSDCGFKRVWAIARDKDMFALFYCGALSHRPKNRPSCRIVNKPERVQVIEEGLSLSHDSNKYESVLQT